MSDIDKSAVSKILNAEQVGFSKCIVVYPFVHIASELQFPERLSLSGKQPSRL